MSLTKNVIEIGFTVVVIAMCGLDTKPSVNFTQRFSSVCKNPISAKGNEL
jgi:hypothetical protein